MSFIHDDFLLETKAARRLYHDYAKAQPILDYHCHLPPKDVADDRRFANLFEIWLEGDHYKWRAMRASARAGALLHGRRRSVRQIQGLGRDRSAVPAEPPVSLDAPGTEAVLRHRRAVERADGR